MIFKKKMKNVLNHNYVHSLVYVFMWHSDNDTYIPSRYSTCLNGI